MMEGGLTNDKMLGLGSSITTQSGVYTTGGGGGVTYIAANTFSLSEDNSTGSVLSVVSSQADDNSVTKTDVVKIVAGKDLASSDNVAAVTSSGISDLTDGSTVNITFSVYYPSANTTDSTSSVSIGYVGGSGSANKINGTNSTLGEWNTFTGTVTVGSSNNNLSVFVDDAGSGRMSEDDEFYLAEVRVY